MVLSVRILRRFLGLRAETGACLLSTRATERDRFDRGVERSGARRRPHIVRTGRD